jgi:hypothetical protein
MTEMTVNEPMRVGVVKTDDGTFWVEKVYWRHPNSRFVNHYGFSVAWRLDGEKVLFTENIFSTQAEATQRLNEMIGVA